MCYYIIQNIIETIRHLVPRLQLQRGRWSLGLDPVCSAPAHGIPSRLPPRDCVSRSDHGASPSVRSNVRLFVVLRDRPGHAESREGGSIWKPTWPKTLTVCNEQISHAFSSRGFILCRLAEPRPRIRECLTPRVYVASQSNAISHVA